MDTQKILDAILASGKDLTAKATDFAEKNLGLPKEGPDRDAMLGNLGKGALAGGVAAILLATKTGRKLSGKLLAVGSVAAVGTLAYQAYQKWAQSQGKATDAQRDAPVLTLTGVAADKRSQLLLRAMIAAAKSDGVVDPQEQQFLEEQLKHLDVSDDAGQWLRSEMQNPHDADSIAKQVDSVAAAAEVYFISKLIVDDASPAEAAYLRQLQLKLKLDQGLINQIEAQMV